jgi:hypothetical protein
LGCIRIRRNTISYSVRSSIYYFSDKKSERAKDMHLVKKLAALLKMKSPNMGRYPLIKTMKDFCHFSNQQNVPNGTIKIPLLMS